MGEIIKFPSPEENPNKEKEVKDDEDGGKIVELPKSREKISAPTEQDVLRGLAGEFLEKVFGEISLSILDKKFLEVRRYIASLEGFRRSNETRTLRGELISSLTDAELAGLLAESNETDWSAHPSYYLAIIEELQRRFFEKLGLSLGDILKETTKPSFKEELYKKVEELGGRSQ